MASEVDGRAVRYRRRLDRTPEKEFEKLPDSEKKLMSAMREALENCRNRIVGMKDELDEKETSLEAERSRRKEAEERLKQFLVDPYPSPEVNSELRHRLPRANKSDPLLDQQDSESTEDAEVEEETASKSKSTRTHAKSSSASPGGGVRKKKKVRRVLTPSDNQSARGSRDVPDGRGEASYTSTEEEGQENLPQSRPRSSRSRGKGRHSSEYPSAAPPLYSPLQYLPYTPGGGGYQGGQYMPPLYRPLNLTPWSSMSSMPYSPLFSPREGQPTPQQTRIPQSRSFPLLNGEHVAGLGPSVHFDEAAAKPMHVSADEGLNSASSAQPATKASQHTEAAENSNQTSASASKPSLGQKPAMPSELRSQSASSLSSHYALPPTLGRPMEGGSGGFLPSFPNIGLPLYGSPPLASGLSTPYGDASARTVTLLHEEIARLKEANRQLTDSLSSKTQEIETLKLQILAEAPGDPTLETESARKFTELMQEVRAAEKKREEAMKTRITQLEQAREQLMRDVDNIAQKDSVDEKRPRRRLGLRDLSTESETEDSEEEEEEEEQRTRKHHQPNRKENFQFAGAPSLEAGRVASLKDALKELEKRQERELEIYREELQVVMQQRDEALDQLQMEREKSQVHQLRMPAQREQMLMAKISALQREKDRAEETVRQLKDEQMERHLFVNLHKALFPDSALNDCDKTTQAAEAKLKAKLADEDEDVRLEKKLRDEKEDNQLLEQLRSANQDKSLLQRKCEELEAECRKEKDEKDKLERLNGVLRKKLIAVSMTTQQLQEE